MTGRQPLALVLPTLNGGGSQRITLTLAQALARRGWPVDLVLLQRRGALLDQVPAGVRRVVLGDGHYALSLPRLVRYLRQARPRAVLSGTAPANCLAVWARRLAGVPMRLVLIEHNTPSVAFGPGTAWRRRQLPRCMRRTYPAADALVGVSGGVARDLAATLGRPPAAVTAIPNPVVTTELRTRSRAVPDHPWLAADQPPVILAAGRLCPQKDFSTLLEAFARLAGPARLVILGEGPQRRHLEARIDALGLRGTVDLPGFAPNPWGWMRRAGVFALSSRWEGLPTVLIEALACGTPVVSTDCPSGPGEILEGGRWGTLVPVADPAALARALARALDSPAPSAAEAAARDQWLQQFTPDRAARAYEAVLGPQPG